MKDEFAAYLSSLFATDTVIFRVQQILDFYEGVCPEKIDDIFVSEYIKNDLSFTKNL